MKKTLSPLLLRVGALVLGYAALSQASPSNVASVTLLSTSQAQKELSASIDAYYQLKGQPLAYLMLDKPLYQPGESIWFRLDLRKSASLLPQSETKGTAELLDPKGAVQAKKRIIVKNGVGANDFSLSSAAPGGEYTIRFTSDNGLVEKRNLIVASYEAPRLKKTLEFLRKAYGPGADVSAAIKVERATGEAFDQKTLTAVVTVDEKEVSRNKVTTDKEGNAVVKFTLPKEMTKGDGLLTILVDDGGVTESIQKRIPILLQNITLEMYPEGGELVEGLPSRVYFSALNSIGKPADVEGRVVDSRGKEVTKFSSVRDGMGRFSITPYSEEKYFVQITKPEGISKKIELPKVALKGCTIMAQDDFSSADSMLKVNVACTSEQNLVAEAVLREKTLNASTFSVAERTPSTLSIDVGKSQGALRFTLFDEKKNPLAERLIYRGRGQAMKIALTPDKKTYTPREKVTLSLLATDLENKPIEADLGLSVVDDTVLSFADDKTANLISHMFLEKGLPDVTIEDPNFYFSDKPEAAEALDMVMGTKGYRRFDWTIIKAGDIDKDAVIDLNDKCPIEGETINSYKDTDGCPEKDSDYDNIPDETDKCPSQPEIFNSYQDTDGCPEKDTDYDSIPDGKDKCPTQEEDFNSIKDDDGCPEDPDYDGLLDSKDKCPKQPEDFNGYKDEDGCPDDPDYDGITNDKDKCPYGAEDFNGIKDTDGCPEDQDYDGINNDKDKCPNSPEDFNGKDDKDGCPETSYLKKPKSSAWYDMAPAMAYGDGFGLGLRGEGIGGGGTGEATIAPSKPKSAPKATPAVKADPDAALNPFKSKPNTTPTAPVANKGKAATGTPVKPAAVADKPVAGVKAPTGAKPALAAGVEKKPIAPKGGDDIDPATGYSKVRVFPQPEYKPGYNGPRDDFRETIYWNPQVKTGKDGKASVSFYLSDTVTAFKATAEGFSVKGLAGRGEANVQSKLPLALDVIMPLEVSEGDQISLPVTITNETTKQMSASINASFGKAFSLGTNPAEKPITLAAGEKKSVFYTLTVVGKGGEGEVSLSAEADGLKDEVSKTIKVVPLGFPAERSFSGTLKDKASHELDLSFAVKDTADAVITLYPSPLASMLKGADGILREPSGCFEQTSSSNYPNVMVMQYMQSNDVADPALLTKAQGLMGRGYKRLIGYETKEKGYEWFGGTPAHEALTAYGLMEFVDMGRLDDEIDQVMISRTADWLLSRRDGQGGFKRDAKALDSFGRAGEETTNSYITWALSEAKKTKGLEKELDYVRKLGYGSKDPYIVALAANTFLNIDKKSTDSTALAKSLAGLQDKNGSFPGAKESITKSGGDSLLIESTSLSLLALIKASPSKEYESNIRAGIEWLNTKRSGWGQWGNTQGTILSLKALSAYADYSRSMQASGTVKLFINGKEIRKFSFEAGHKDPIVFDNLSELLSVGKNTVELTIDGKVALPYSIVTSYRTKKPETSPKVAVELSTELTQSEVKMGESVRMKAHLVNVAGKGIPMTLARLGLPGGLTFQTWQLKELKDKGIIGFYETSEREVILYFRALPEGAKVDIDLDLIARTPGSFSAPPSSAYLYYTNELKYWAPATTITVKQ